MSCANLAAYYDARRRRVPPSSAAQQIASFLVKMAMLGDTKRPNRGYRVQAQIILTEANAYAGDDCVLEVFNTGIYDRFLALMMDYKLGLVGVRSLRAHVSPLMLPDWLQAQPTLNNLNDMLRYLHDVHDGKPVARWSPARVEAGEWDAFVARAIEWWPRLGMPPAHVPLRIVRPRAAVGSLVLWKGYHGNSPALSPFRPCVSMFVDYAPRETFGEENLQRVAELMATHPVQYSAGTETTRHAGYNHWANEHHGRAGGLARLAAADTVTELDRWLAGAPNKPEIKLEPMLSPEQIADFEEKSFLVVPPEQLAQHVPRWQQLCDAAATDLAEFMSDVIIRAEKLEGAHTDFDFANAADPRWEAIGGTQKAAKRIFGDEYAMNKRGADGARVKSAQNGGSMLTMQSGMGAAANLYDSPAQQRLQLALYPLFAQLYRSEDLVWMPERFRVRTNDKAHLPIHTDTKVSFA